MRIVFIGTVVLSRACLEKLIALGAEVVGVVSRESSNFHSDFASLSDECERHRIPCHLTSQINSLDTVAWIRSKKPDVAFCFGWSQLIGAELLSVPALGVVGYHPALLPENRGRHPLIWALALGLTETGSTFFLMDAHPDSGDIISQRRVEIRPEDDAATLYARVTATALGQIEEFLPKLASDTCPRTPQDHRRANAWRKRTPSDGRIDWRMPSAGIRNLVQALVRPYPGATVRRGDGEFVVWRTAISDMEVPKNLEPGRVLAIEGRALTVKTGDGAIVLTSHEFDALPEIGECL